jgi:hypothetical protein
MGLGKWVCNPASNYDDYLNYNTDHGCANDNDNDNDHHHCRADYNNNYNNHGCTADNDHHEHGCAYDQFFLVCSGLIDAERSL